MRFGPGIATARRPRLLIGLVAVLGASFLAGCGGGGEDEPSEDVLRSRLAAAFERTDDARSIRTLDSFEVDIGDGETTSGCIDITVERVPGGGAKTERFALQSHVDDCAHGPVTGEMVLVGRSLWVSSGDGSFTPASIDPKLVPELTEEGIDFGDLPTVATEIGLGNDPAGPATDAGPTYEFEAPGSSLSDEIDADSADIEFEATTDSLGYLTGLTAEIEVEGADANVRQTYEEINQVPPIKPPPRKFVHGRPVRIESKSDLKRLVANIVPEEL